MTDMYSRQQELGLNVPDSVTVVGCGGVGSWVATMLAMSGVPKLYLFDPDALEPTNFNRLPLPPVKSGTNKARALREWLITLRPGAMIAANGSRADGVVMAKTEALFDCTDDFTVREPLYVWCQENRVRYIRAGYDGGNHVTVAHSLPWQAGTPLARYDVVPSWVVPAIMVAALAVWECLMSLNVNGNGSLSLDIEALVQAAHEVSSGK